MDTLGSVRILHGVANEGSFSGAARVLGLSVSSVARQMDMLEERIGVTLLVRTTRRVSLTAKGRAFLADALRARETFDAAVARARDGAEDLSGMLRITAAPSVGRTVLPRILQAFTSAHPEISIDLTLTDAVIDLAEAGIDIAIRVGDPSADSSLVVRDLRPMQRQICASPKFFERYGVPDAPTGLSSFPCLLFRPPQGQHSWLSRTDEWHFHSGDHSETVRVIGKIASSDADALLALARVDLGVLMLPDWMVTDDLEAGRLQACLGEYRAGRSEDPKTLHLAYQARDRETARVAAFRAHAVDWFSRHGSAL